MKYLLTIFLIISSSSALACSPIRVKPELKDWKVIERFKDSDLVLLAEFKNIQITPPVILGNVNSFKVKDYEKSNIQPLKIYKGSLPSKLIIEIKNVFCGQSISLNKKYLMYAVKHENNYKFSYVPLSSEYSERDFKILKEIKYKYTDPETMTYEKYLERITVKQ